MSPGLIIAAPASGSGKTTVTLALLRCLRRAGVAVGSAKVGPDYIDPAYHAAASGRPCINLDTWAMRPETLARLVDRAGEGAQLVIAEGVMGLFDGAPDGRGSTADLAEVTGWPVVLVVDARGMASSAAALIHGFATYRPGLQLAGVIFNRVGSARHAGLLQETSAAQGTPMLAALQADPGLRLPERHLGLVQAAEHPQLETFLEHAADVMAAQLDIGTLVAMAQPARCRPVTGHGVLPPLGQRIAVAEDLAFAFAYPFVLEGWHAAGAELRRFSPLAGEGPDADCDAVYLPGGYPELHAERLAASAGFLGGLRAAADRGAAVYGECGGYMVLGRSLVDAEGRSHPMAGLLPVETSFAERRLSLGYRRLALAAAGPLGEPGAAFRGHEFHYARLVSEDETAPLFDCSDGRGQTLGSAGCVAGSVFGSFVHLVDRAPPA